MTNATYLSFSALDFMRSMSLTAFGFVTTTRISNTRLLSSPMRRFSLGFMIG